MTCVSYLFAKSLEKKNETLIRYWKDQGEAMRK
jgi:hypothetical protein